MPWVYLSLGSNIDPEKNVPDAIEMLKQSFPGILISSVYETDPIGPAGNQKFWNLAAALETSEAREKLVPLLRKIEEKLGRVRSGNKYAPRPMDIDLLPQPDYQNQAFIMIPLAEIAPQAKDTATGKTFLEIASGLRENAKQFRKVLA